MFFIRPLAFILGIVCYLGTMSVYADEARIEPLKGSWTFSGLVTNESGEQYGYFFEVRREDKAFHTQAALIDGRTNQLLYFYEDSESLESPKAWDWQIGYSFIRHNPINDSWVFGVKTKDKRGFQFKVDMLKQITHDKDTLILRPGIQLQALQTSQLNGHIQVDEKEQFVTSNKTWFGQLVLSDDQKDAHDISTTFCRLADDNGFYFANLKEKDAISAAAAGWFDPTGRKVKMSQFVSLKDEDKDQCTLDIGLPKLNLKLLNTLKSTATQAIAGFSQENKQVFCFKNNQLFKENKVLV